MTSFFHGVEIVEVNEGFSSVKTLSSSVIGLIGVDKEADGEAFPLNKPVLLSSNKNEALSKLGKESVLHQSIEAIELQQCSQIVVIRVEEGETDEETLKNLIGGIDPETGAYTGVQAFCGAESIVHVVPKILMVPGYFKGGTADKADPLLTAMLPVAEKLKAIIIADGPNTNDEAALAAAKSANSERVYLVDPYVLNTAGEAVPASPYAAGVLSRVEEEKGFWFSPSNTPILGLTSSVRPVDFALGNANCRILAQEHGIPAVVSSDLQGIRIPTLHQSSESDLHFLTRLGQKYNLLIKPAGGSLVAIPLRGGASGRELPEVTLTPDSVINWAYKVSKKEDIPSVTAKGYDPDTASEFHETAGGHTSGGQSLGYALRGLYPTREAAKQAAQAAYEKLIQKIHTFSATVIGHPWIAAEARLALRGFPTELPSRWQISRATHALTNTGYTTDLEAMLDEEFSEQFKDSE